MSRGRVESLFARARAGQVALVLAELRDAVARDAGDVEGWLALGLVLADQDRWAEALDPLARAAAPDDAPLVARATFARALEQTGHLDGARVQLEKARAAAPGHVGIARALASVLRRAGDLAAADACLAEALAAARTGAERAQVAVDRGAVARARGDLDGALALFGEALDLDPDRDDAPLAAAEVHAEIGDFAAALAAVDRLLARGPAHAAASRMRASILRARGEARASRAAAPLFHAPPRPDEAGDPRVVAEAATRFLAGAIGAPLTAAAAAHLLARIAAHGAVDVDDLRVAAEERDGALGLRVTRR